MHLDGGTAKFRVGRGVRLGIFRVMPVAGASHAVEVLRVLPTNILNVVPSFGRRLK